MAGMNSRKDYNAQQVEAARRVMVDLFHLLGEYREDIALVGGWVPFLLIDQSAEGRHVGSTDVDLAFNHQTLQEPCYQTIKKLLLDNGYEPGDRDFKFFKTVTVEGREYRVEIDLLAGEYEGTGKGHRHQRIQKDVKARKARGCDLAFDGVVEMPIRAELPEGGMDSVRIRICPMRAFLVMKGMALESRKKAKDAYDIYYCVRFYSGGLDALAETFQGWLENGLVKEGLRKIADKFSSVDDVGPKWVADFYETTDAEERARRQREAFEWVNELLKRLNIE